MPVHLFNDCQKGHCADEVIYSRMGHLADLAEGDLEDRLLAYQAEMAIRANGHMADAKRRLHLSVRSGWRVYTRNVLLWCMGRFTWLADWVLSRYVSTSSPLLVKSNGWCMAERGPGRSTVNNRKTS